MQNLHVYISPQKISVYSIQVHVPCLQNESHWYEKLLHAVYMKVFVQGGDLPSLKLIKASADEPNKEDKTQVHELNT